MLMRRYDWKARISISKIINSLTSYGTYFDCKPWIKMIWSKAFFCMSSKGRELQIENDNVNGK